MPEGSTVCSNCGRGLLEVSDSDTPETFQGATQGDDETKLHEEAARHTPRSRISRYGLRDTYVPQEESFASGRRLMDRYEIVCELGRGGMGVVYQAIDHARDADTALKTVPAELRRDPRAITMLKREVNTALTLTHENICRVYDFQECSEAAFITMELIDGHSLDDLLSQREKEGSCGFPFDQVVAWLMPICGALDYAHRKGIVHRDLKPGNVMVTRNGTVKLTDFGLARAIRTSMSKYSREAMSGTLLYMSPEQCLGKPTDARSDVYSLGMMTYELLTGRAPFADAADITYCHLKERIEAISAQPGHVNAALAKACAKQKEERHASAGTFFAALEKPASVIEVVADVCSAQPIPKPRDTPSRKTGETMSLEIDEGISMELVWLSAGTYTMQPMRSVGDNRPLLVSLTRGIWFGKYPVTQSQWYAVMGNNPSRFRGPANPVECVSWHEAQSYINKLSTTIHTSFRLPTEAEWEYACRAGSTTRWHFGDNESELPLYAWFADNSGGRSRPIGRVKPNAWGLYDMHGNVNEWCSDKYDPGFRVEADAIENPQGPPDGWGRVLRGGSWESGFDHTTSGYASMEDPDYKYNGDVGFRICRNE